MSIESILKVERAKTTLPVDKLSEFIYTPMLYQQRKILLQAGEVHEYTPNIYNKSRLDLIKDAYTYLPHLYNFQQKHPQFDQFHSHVRPLYGLLVNPHQLPGSVHITMFLKYIELMGTEEHKKMYLQRCKTYEIVGCYAQTEIGHGSDIRGLQTTAILDLTTQQWIINTPSISAAKYWPGELSILANYALVFAQAIVNGKSKGVYPFLLKIKDEEYNWLPGIEGGDIGPKIGNHAKENGYMFIHNIRIPKNNLLSKYVQVNSKGEFKTVGDPRVGYGTMMHIRQMISCVRPKLYALPIIIGARYSLFRRQFRNGKKEEVAIIDYQTQQEKIIPRIAEYYALCVGANKIREGSEQNLSRLQKNDFSLLQQTHSNLSFSKCLYSQIAHEGMQTVRRALGGHGTSYYSGIPQLLNEYAAANTYQGQNTVLYVQTARYVLKSYIGYISKKKALTESVKYIQQFPVLKDVKIIGKNAWTVDDLRNVFLKSILHVLTIITSRLANKKSDETQMDIINYKVGMRLQQLAQLHGVYFTVNSFIQAINKEQTYQIKPLLTDLCKLFAFGQIQRLSEPIIEAGFICPVKYGLIADEKQEIFSRVRPSITVLLDSFAVPDKYLRSELVKGNPYNNYLDRARECELNQSIQESAKIVSKIKDVLAHRTELPKL